MKKLLILTLALTSSFNLFSTHKIKSNNFMNLSGSQGKNKPIRVDQARDIGGHPFITQGLSLLIVLERFWLYITKYYQRKFK